MLVSDSLHFSLDKSEPVAHGMYQPYSCMGLIYLSGNIFIDA